MKSGRSLRELFSFPGFVAAATLLVFAAFGLYVLNGGDFEMRTVGALTLRALFWIAITIVSRQDLPGPANGRLRQ